jgi:hypothetical protein
MEMEEDVLEQSIQAEVRLLSETPKYEGPVDFDDDLLRLLKGRGYSLARRSLGIEISDSSSSTHSVDSGAGILHSTGLRDESHCDSRLSRISIAILSMHSSLKAAFSAPNVESASGTTSLPGTSSSWSVSSVTDAEVAANNWVVDDRVADNLFRLRQTISSRLYARTNRNFPDFPDVSNASVHGAFGAVVKIGEMALQDDVGAGGRRSESNCNDGLGYAENVEMSSGAVDEIVAIIGGAVKSAFSAVRDGVDAGTPKKYNVFLVVSAQLQ